MEKTPAEHQKVLQDLDRLMSEATDEASREEIRRLRDSMNTPQMIEMARAAEKHKERRNGNPVLEFHDTVVPWYVAAAGCVIAIAICLYALLLAFEIPVIVIGGRAISPWLIATCAGAISLGFTALSVMRPFSIRFDTEGMISRVSGARWRRLQVGAMPWKNIRSLHERTQDRVLEVRAAGGEVFEIPVRVANYAILRNHLDNMILLYGERT
ncbi:MAG TPA: hypothetical protein VGO61_15960 [Steroidobacteraceae bacterium]|jgi:hypothetical protein|nr:hypothetical protein [Steroidobacteraceae bacterium]